MQCFVWAVSKLNKFIANPFGNKKILEKILDSL